MKNQFQKRRIKLKIILQDECIKKTAITSASQNIRPHFTAPGHQYLLNNNQCRNALVPMFSVLYPASPLLLSCSSLPLYVTITVRTLSNSENYLRSNFPADSDGSLCGHDFPQYQYLYFANLPDIVLTYRLLRIKGSVCNNVPKQEKK